MSEMQLAVLDLEVVLVCWDILVNANLGLGRAMVLDLHFQIEGRNTLQCDRDDFFAFRFSGAVAVGLSWLVEASTWAWVNGLLDGDGREVFLGVIVAGVGELLKGVLVRAGLGGL